VLRRLRSFSHETAKYQQAVLFHVSGCCIPSAVPVGPLLACQDFMVLALPAPNFLLITINRPIFNMTPRKSHRVRKARTIWEQKGAPSAAKDPKITKKSARTVEKTALKPIATGPLSKAVGFDADNLSDLSTYKLPLDLEFQAAESLTTKLSELKMFQKLLMPAIVNRIVDATNSYAKNVRTNASKLPGLYCHTRPWKPINSTDI
jgi:hypothetical protein